MRESCPAQTMAGWGTSFLRREELVFLSLLLISFSNCLCLQSGTIGGLENPESPSVIKSTSGFISWELSNYSPEDVFIANYTSELCPWLDFRLWLGLADQILSVCVFSLSPAPSGAHRIIGNQIPRGPSNSRWSRKARELFGILSWAWVTLAGTWCALPCNPLIVRYQGYLNSISSLHFPPFPNLGLAPWHSGHWLDSECDVYVCSSTEMIPEGKFPPLWERFFPALERMGEPGMIWSF